MVISTGPLPVPSHYDAGPNIPLMTESRPGWRLHAHPLLLAQLARLHAAAVRDAANNRATSNARLLASVHRLMFDHIPSQPRRLEYRTNTQSWLRARFAGGRFQLYFQADPETRRILYGWIAEPETLQLHAADNQPFVMHGHICTVTQTGNVVLPAAARDALGLQAGGQIGFRADGNKCVLTRHVHEAAGSPKSAVNPPSVARLKPPAFPDFPMHAMAALDRSKRNRRVLQ